MKKKTEVPHIRFTVEEVEKLKGNFKKTKFSTFSSYIRFLIFSKNVEIKFSSTEEELARQIGDRNKKIGELNRQVVRIGTNINQITKKINSQQYVMREDMNVLLEYLKTIENAVLGFKE